MKFTTKRLILRPPTMRDVAGLVEQIGNIKVSRYLLAVAHPYTEADAKWWINHCKER